MGRVKSLAIKRTTRKLLEENPELFTADFEKNKRLLSKVLETDKRTRNSIAGYITRIKKQETEKRKNKSY
ncbi:MAG: 30S ribosomal protein S17e [Candidatus Pacearchaeota archaeon]|nr:30S ribosomal protein S17e [Candidatus Pacearchaeota archaeon]